MRILENIEPKEVFHYFEDICAIPHASYHEKEISDYLVAFAKKHKLEYYQDDLYNVIMIKEASAGYEEAEPIILQGHMDMVCEKENDCPKDMDREGLDLVVDGDYVSARGTTLGGDDGIAVAYALAILASDVISHPRLEFVCTVSEEVGMEGAQGIDVSMLKSHLLLNLDSEKEGEILASCAGGGSLEISLRVRREDFSGKTVLVHVSGLVGGHSGTEIDKGRANATLLLVRALCDASEATGLRLAAFEGGSKDNAIPREAKALVRVADPTALAETLASVEKAVRNEYSAVDPDICICMEEAVEVKGLSADVQPLDKRSTEVMLTLMQALPNGVIRMSHELPGLVETSLNMGIAYLTENHLTLRLALRSSVASAYDGLKKLVVWVSRGLGATVKASGEYPAWEYVKDSPLRDRMCSIYREMFGKELVVEAIHAGVECGLLAGKIENLDAISMGPDILDIHTPTERLSISSTKRMYDFILRILEEGV